MGETWEEFSDADVHIVELIRAAKSGRCVEHERWLFIDYWNEARDFEQFAVCSEDDSA